MWTLLKIKDFLKSLLKKIIITNATLCAKYCPNLFTCDRLFILHKISGEDIITFIFFRLKKPTKEWLNHSPKV